MNDLKAEFWFCMARAFLPPQDNATRTAMREALADDLTELANVLGYTIGRDIDDLRRAMDAIDRDQDLLVSYSRLFLVPGVAHPPLNAGTYFDGAVHGDTVRRLVECYRVCGLEKSETFADLPDHVATQLEFVAWLFAVAAAREQGENAPIIPLDAIGFIAAFVARWALLFERDLEQAGIRFGLIDNPWLPLARILTYAARQEVAALVTVPLASEKSEIEILRERYAGREPDAIALAEVRRVLEAKGHGVAHLDRPAGAPDALDGFTPLQPPRPPRAVAPSA